MTGNRSWGGAYPNPPRVVRVLPQSLQGIPQCPYLVVSERSGSEMVIEATTGGGLHYRHDFRITVTGFMQATPDTAVSTWIQRLWDDVWKTTGGQAAPLDGLEGCRMVEPEGEALFDDGELGENLGAFAQGYLITLDEEIAIA